VGAVNEHVNIASLEENSEQIVFVIDDDESVRVALTHLFRSMNLHVEVFSTAAAFLESNLPNIPSCLVLDIRLPGMNGLQFQDALAAAGIHIPIVFITGHGNIPMSVKAMKAGAVDFLPKPFHDQDMLDALIRALDLDRKRRDEERYVSQLRQLFEALTKREQQVLTLVVSGLMNKEIAHRLQISQITVKVHRGHMMKKMEARSLVDLVRRAEMLGIRRAA
jgi:FixJ family two-component response regulator